MRNVILCGDVIDKLKELPDKSVQCVVTSPPYYALRSYGTGKWVGGDPDCEHETVPARNLGRDWILIDLNPEYVKLAEERLRLNESLDTFLK